MLYLNDGVLPSAGPLGIYLTLTNVVFECF